MNRLIILLLISSIVCCKKQTNYDCIVASSPTDFKITNSFNYAIDVYLFDFSEGDYGLIKKIHLRDNDEKFICLENEGPLSEGLYIYRNGVTSKIKLLSQQENSFDLNDSTYIIPTPQSLKKLIEK